MRTKYIDLIDQTFDFPQNEFNLRKDRLFFHGIDAFNQRIWNAIKI